MIQPYRYGLKAFQPFHDRMGTQTQHTPSYEIHRQPTPTHFAPRHCALQKISPAPVGFHLGHAEWTSDSHRASFLPQAIQIPE